MSAQERFDVDEMDKNGQFNGKGGRRKGVTLSWVQMILAFMIGLFLLVAAILITYNFGICSNINVQSEVCDKKNVIPITIAMNKSQSDDTKKLVKFEEDLRNNRTNVRLPRTMHPIHYELKLMPIFIIDNYVFDGSVRILVNVTKSCQNVTLHVTELKISDVIVSKIDNAMQPENISRTEIEVSNKYAIEPDQLYIIVFPSELQPNNTYEIYIKYTGILNDMLQGFYRSSYVVNNETRVLATTQFQPTDARRAFPCFDEPAYKAKFKIFIGRPMNMIALSNMPKMNTSDEIKEKPGYVWDEFEESVPMSTYLVAFVVSDFKNLTDGRISVWTRPDALESGRYALEIGVKMLDLFEKYFNITYPLPKLDMIAVPDFSAGAMENFGLVIYREVTLLHDENESSQVNRQRVATIIAHELVHQWFGNLVTPSWWSDLWLNEGFASYMEYVGADKIHPEWKAMDQFLCNEVQSVLILDSLASSHEISVHVHDPDSITELFDRISYGKGAAIIRMMEHFLTTPVFQNGLHSYLTDKAYQVATPNDLWEHLTKSAQESHTFDNLTNVKEIMDAWTTKMGFPVVNVTRNYTTNHIDFAQNRFTFIAPSQWKSLQIKYNEALWWIPLSYTTAGEADFMNTKPKDWIRGTQTFGKDFTNITNDDWIIVNIQGTGYYRVNYDETNWRLLTNYLQNPEKLTKIAPTNRAQIIDDALTLARAGQLDYRIALNLTRYLVNETEYVPWRTAIGAFSFIESMISSGSDYYLFKNFMFSLIHKIYHNVTTSTDVNDHLLQLKRVEITQFACRLGYKACVDRSIRLFNEWMNSTDPDKVNNIPPTERSVVYCTAVKYGTDETWEFAWNRYMNTTISSEKESLLEAMACSRESWTLARYLERSCTDKSGIRRQDLLRVFVSVSNQVNGVPVTYNFIRLNWDRIKTYAGPPPMNMYVILMYVFKNANTQYDLNLFQKLVKENISEQSRLITQAIEGVKTNIVWMDNNYKTIIDWLGNVTNS